MLKNKPAAAFAETFGEMGPANKSYYLATAFDSTPFFARQAIAFGYIDRLSYYDELRFGIGMRFLSYDQYASATIPGPRAEYGNIDIIYGIGDIYDGTSTVTPMGSFLLGAQTVTEAFREAIEDKTIRAIVFRINSPGDRTSPRT